MGPNVRLANEVDTAPVPLVKSEEPVVETGVGVVDDGCLDISWVVVVVCPGTLVESDVAVGSAVASVVESRVPFGDGGELVVMLELGACAEGELGGRRVGDSLTCKVGLLADWSSDCEGDDELWRPGPFVTECAFPCTELVT